jgi:hypothetical protein
VDYPAEDISLQELHNLIRSDIDELDNLDDPQLIKSFGKQDLGGGTQVGITSELQDARLAFAPRTTSIAAGTVTTANSAGTDLYDTSGLFVTNGVEPGATIINLDDESVATVLNVVSEGHIECYALDDGVSNQFSLNDAYKIWNVQRCVVSGGNITSVDSIGDPLIEIFPTAFTQVVVEKSSSATISSISEDRLDELAGLMKRNTVIRPHYDALGNMDYLDASFYATAAEAADDYNGVGSPTPIGQIRIDAVWVTKGELEKSKHVLVGT